MFFLDYNTVVTDMVLIHALHVQLAYAAINVTSIKTFKLKVFSNHLYQ